MTTGGTILEIEEQIKSLRAAQEHVRNQRRAALQLDSDAIHAELVAREARQKARQYIDECDDLDTWYGQELDRLVAELVKLIPQQRRVT